MNQQTATVVFSIIMSIGAFIWLVSLRMAMRLGKPAMPEDSQPVDILNSLPFATEEFGEDRGSVTLTGDVDRLCGEVHRTLQQSFHGQLTTLYQIRRHSSDRIVLKKSGALICNVPTPLYFTEAEIEFQPQGGRQVVVNYRLGFGRVIRLARTISLGIVLGIGLPVMIGVGCVMWLYVIPSPVPAVRWQVFQTLQIAHALWPPFMYMNLYWSGRRQSNVWFENLIANVNQEFDSGSEPA